MNIDIFEDYNVTIKTLSSYVSEESEPGDIIYKSNEYYQEFVTDGGRLLRIIGRYCNDPEICYINFFENLIKLGTFNPMDGTGDDVMIDIERKDD